MDTTSIIRKFDDRREMVIPGNDDSTIDFASVQFIQLGQEAIQNRGAFFVALSGGSTPSAIYSKLSHLPQALDWSKVFLFWSDERAVNPESNESNYRMAMLSGLNRLPIKQEHIFRMQAEPQVDIQNSSVEYQKIIFDTVPHGVFDLVMLGMGEDGHTASLFPHTQALHVDSRTWVTPNYLTHKKCWRMTLTFSAINSARRTIIYVLGKNKAEMVTKVLKGYYAPDRLPVQRVGTHERPALWILDEAAASELEK